MGPPELHIVLVGFRGLAHAVDEVEESFILLVPARGDGVAEDLLGGLVEGFIPGGVGLLRQEPAAFDVVARVHDPARGGVRLQLPVGTHGLQDAL